MAKKLSPKRLKAFLNVAPKDRNNSNSIRRLLFDVIWHHFNRSTTAAAHHFREVLRDSKHRRKFRTSGRGLSEWPLYRVTRDDQPIAFTQLDAIAQHLNVPLAVILLFTRIRSEIEMADGHDVREAGRVLTSTKAAINRLEEILNSWNGPIENVYDHLSHKEFEEVRRAYINCFDEMRDRLL
jgi:hypothetical protein